MGTAGPASPPPSRPTLRLLGGGVIVVAGEPLGGAAAHRHRIALLALLAVDGLMSRDKLVAYLWPERDTAGARALLKTAVHELRKLLGDDAIRSIGDQLDVNPAMLGCDVAEFEAAVAAGDAHAARALYRGPFLDGFFVKGSSEFEDWAAARRERLADTYSRILPAVAAQPISVKVPVASPSAALPVPASRRRRWALPAAALATVAVLGVAAIANGRNGKRQGAIALAGHPAVTLPDDALGSALEFDGVDANVSTRVGTVATTLVDNIAWDLMVRFDGSVPALGRQTIVYNGHSGVSGWGILVLDSLDHVPAGTVGLLAGGTNIVATPLVLKRGAWQRLRAERRDGRVTVWLDDRAHVVGPFPVNPVGGRWAKLETTSFGSSGFADKRLDTFRGAIDRVRLMNLENNWSVDRWFLDEGNGSVAIGVNGTKVDVARARWIPGGKRAAGTVFWSRLEALCGHAYGGRLVEGNSSDSLLRKGPLIMDVRDCTPNEIRIALHVGDDRSRTWVLTRHHERLRLKHVHRHRDGSLDRVTDYGGDTQDAGSIGRQEFRADAHTATLIPAARTNVWTIEVDPLKTLSYALRREGTDRRVRLVFDIERVLASPPAPWGAP